MKFIISLLCCLVPLTVTAQAILAQSLKMYVVKGSVTLYHLESDSWMHSDSSDALKETLPASILKF